MCTIQGRNQKVYTSYATKTVMYNDGSMAKKTYFRIKSGGVKK